MIKKNAFVLLLFIVHFAQSGINYNLLRFNHYGNEDGLPQNVVTTVHQDSKGYLWIGTNDGLARFNGYEFEKMYYDPYSSNSLIGNNILHICNFNPNVLMITTTIGVSFYDIEKNVFKNVYVAIKGLGTLENAILNKKKEIVISTTKGTYNLFLKDTLQDTLRYKWAQIKNEPAIQLNFKNKKIAFNFQNKLYHYSQTEFLPVEGNHNKVSYSKELKNGYFITYHEGKFIFYAPKSNEPNFFYFISPDIEVNYIEIINGLYWIATNKGVLILNVNDKNTQIKEANWIKQSKYNPNGIGSNEVLYLFEDKFGIIWIAGKKGLDKVDPTKQQFLWFKRSEILQDPNLNNNCLSFFENKNYLISSYIDGLLVYNKLQNSYSSVLTNMPILSIVQHDKNNLLLFSKNSVSTLKLDSLLEINYSPNQYKSLNDSLKKTEIYKVLIKDKTIWIGTDQKLLVYHSDKQIYSYTMHRVRAIDFASDGSIWCTSGPSKIHQLQFKQNKYIIKTIEIKELNQVPALSIHAQNDNVWIGLWGGGLVNYDVKNNTIKHYSKKDGLSNNTIFSILPYNKHELWMSTNSGISRFKIKEQKFTNFSIKDGLQGMEFNLGAYYLGLNGKLYFGGTDGYNVVDPSKRFSNDVPPIIYLQGIYSENENLLLSNKIKLDKNNQSYIKLPYNKSSITFKIDALHYGEPQENIVAYNFIGLNDEWVTVENKREFYFANMNPGEYIFKIRAANSDGVWSPYIKSFIIIIQPPFWQTWWFIGILIAIVIALLGSFYFSRIALVKKQKLKLERMVRQRTQEVVQQKAELEKQKALIEEEKLKEEKLLLNILPRETAIELLNTGKAAPKSYRKATVMFADFKNFTRIAENLRPSELIAELDDSFAHFDDIVGVYNIEKIKTSGDAYMCVGGIPIRNTTNPVDCVLAALAFQRYMETKRKSREGTGKPQWNLRIGIHTGELIAGVVGKKKFLYDVWGDTVNIAARMETTSDPGKVNISGATYHEIKPYFDCEYRGKLPVKNKGAIDMYYVHRIKPMFSVDAKGIEPNERFYEVLKFNSHSEISFNRASKFIMQKLKAELPSNLYYHGMHHTKDVIDAVERIGKAEGIQPEELMLVKLGALLHDAGFMYQYQNNEELGAKMATEILPKYGFNPEQVKIVENMIMATKIPQNPQTHLEQILCDADLDYLGRSKEEFEKISSTLSKELLEFGFLKSIDDWDPIQVKFLASHKYFTQTSIQSRREFKLQRLAEITARLAKKDAENNKGE
jgi:class 3 adenylate cyclase/ligand-binding sensor domain-containing protein/predicted metal-dependent HD superfamily phosphohydrolase